MGGKFTIRYKMKFYLLILFLSIKIGLSAQEIKFRHLNVDNGLSQPSVLAIAQDKKGLLWFGTRNGLNKYDARDIKIYQSTGDTSSLTLGYISQLLVDHEGTLWIGTPNGLNIYQEKTDDFVRLMHHKNEPGSLGNNGINDIYQDNSNRIWICTKGGLSLLKDKNTRKFNNIRFTDQSITECHTIFEDRQGIFWLSTNKGLARMQFSKSKVTLDFSSFAAYNQRINAVRDNHVTTIVQDYNQMIWLGTKQTGLSALNKSTHGFKNYSASEIAVNGLINNNVRKIILANDGRLWIGTVQGIRIFDPARQQFTFCEHDPANAESLSQNSVYSVFQDRQGIFWIGTYYGGVNYVTPNLTPFKKYPVSKTGNAFNNNVISAMLEDREGNLWFCTEGGGLNFLNRKNNRFSHFTFNTKNANNISSNIIKAIIQDRKGNIWIGTYLGNLDVYNPSTNEFRHYPSNPDDNSSLAGREINSLLEDRKGRIWVGTERGLHEFSTSKNNFIRFSGNGPRDAIWYLFEDRDGNLWVSSNSGLYVTDKNTGNFKKLNLRSLLDAIAYSSISCINEDKQGTLWLATNGAGLIAFDPETKKVRKYLKTDGLPSNNITCILNDDAGNIWLSTDKGISKYNDAKKTFINYNTRDGLPGNEFNIHSALKARNGEFFFGGLSGLTSFFPGDIKTNNTVPNIIFTDLKLFNQSARIGQPEEVLKQNISITDAITLNPDHNVFAVDFAVLNFIKSDKNRYAYKLEGFEQNWNYVNMPRASYTNISPGNYTLLVKGSNNDNLWTAPIALKIEVLPPFYRTWWAYLFYLCLISAILIVVVRYLLIKAVLEKEKEVNEHKLAFFTNVSHEIRTPLTLIVGPLEQLMSKTQLDPELNRSLQPIKYNADRLMNLVTELLDFRKAESGKMTLQASPANLIKFSKEIFMAFQNMAIQKNINYYFNTPNEVLMVYFDKLQFEKVLFNLLSNAFKFTPTHGTITLNIEETPKSVVIQVTDNGKGIPVHLQAGLFRSFYQAKPNTNTGTGLGLALTKSIIECHHGTVSVESKEQSETQSSHTCFTIILKKGKSHFKHSELIGDEVNAEDLKNYARHHALATVDQKEGVDLKPAESISHPYTILLVEDNPEVRAFVRRSLEDQYKIVESENGLQGWEQALELIPDLILSDVMMPEMDGLELCRKLKTDERTSHIPVVLLTARSAYVHQINGFENGADAYIMKPFNVKILSLNIHNLLKASENIQRKFAEVVTLEPKKLVINQTQQNFINKIMEFMELNLDNPKFDVPMLSEEMSMSQPVLYKKIRALTGLSVNDFIKSFRLKKAAQLLQNNNGNISEIAFSVGFRDRKYFSAEFKKQFGQTPSEFIQEQKNNYSPTGS